MPSAASNSSGAGLGLDFLSSCCPGAVDVDNFAKPTPFTTELDAKSNASFPVMRIRSDSDYLEAAADSSRCISAMHSPNIGTGSVLCKPQAFVTANQPALSRHGTLLSVNATPERNAAELKSILGSSSSRLKPGAALLPLPGQSSDLAEQGTSLEQAKSRARVEVDIILDNKACVQGGYLQGHVKFRVQKCARSETPVMISGGKVRVIGFESISNELDRYPFYQCSSHLATVTAMSGSLHGSCHDVEGFAQAIEGEHTLPFSMYLPMSADYGVPKGALQVHSGVTVRYVAMVSIKVKDPTSDSRSIAHFYRDCEIWPRLNPSVILAPAERPLQATTGKNLSLGGSGKVELTASVHRLHWIAGQQCFVTVSIVNASKKTIKSVALALIRSTVVFKPHRRLDAAGDGPYMDPDACQTSTTQKQVAESVLEMGQHGTRGHASAKGWWTGVAPAQRLEFSHSILLPPDALSVTRSRLLEIEYSIRVVLNAGALRTAGIQVSLPIRIVNFLSLDPPPSFPLRGAHSDQAMQHLGASLSQSYRRPQNIYQPRPTGAIDSRRSHSRALEPLAEENDERLPLPGQILRRNASQNGSQNESLAPEDAYDGIDYESEEEYPLGAGEHDMYTNVNDDLEDLTVYEDDADEIVPHILHVGPDYENAPRFADLYHTSVQENLYQSAGLELPENDREQTADTPNQHQERILRKQQSRQGHHSYLHPNSRPPLNWTRLNRPQGPSSFGQRVQIKLEAAAVTSNLRHSSLGDASLAHPDGPPIETMHGRADSAPSTGQAVILGVSNGAHPYMQDRPAQDSTDFSGQLQARDYHHPTTTAYSHNTEPHSQPGLRERPFCHAASLDPSESTTSLPYRKITGSAFSNVVGSGGGGSRLLPKPPSMADIPSQRPLAAMEEAVMAFTAPSNTAFDATVLHSSILQPCSADYDPPGLCRISQQSRGPDARERSNKYGEGLLEAVPGVDAHVGSRPSILALKEQGGGSMGGSSNSVKERIRELEERQRLLELNEP